MSDEERRGARRECEILRHLDHPGILHFIEAFEDEGHLCLVAEHCERGDFTKLLADRRGVLLPEATVLDYFVQLLLALLFCHKKKVLHRDLKLANVFVDARGDLRLGDFGIARVLKHTMELAKTVVGTPYYLSPEICENKVGRAARACAHALRGEVGTPPRRALAPTYREPGLRCTPLAHHHAPCRTLSHPVAPCRTHAALQPQIGRLVAGLHYV
jgi:serine/threonine protein kinase